MVSQLKPKKTIVITGTHLTPATELIRQLKTDKTTDWQIHYIGRRLNSTTSQIPSVESINIPTTGVKFYAIDCGKFDRRWLPNTIKGSPLILSSIIKSFQLLSQIKPDIVVSFGGYVSVPVIMAGFFHKIPSITHEQTQTLSLSTKINSLFTTKIALTFKPSQLPSKAVITGNLLRQAIFNNNSSHFAKLINPKLPTIYLTAGNQGSVFLNNLILNCLDQLKNFNVIHQCGPLDFHRIKNLKINQKYYFLHSFIEEQDIGYVLNRANIIISRSGANTSQEIVALSKKSILIPLPQTQQNEQLLNALWVKTQLPNQTLIFNQSEISPDTLIKSISSLLSIKTVAHPTIKPNLQLLNLIHQLV